MDENYRNKVESKPLATADKSSLPPSSAKNQKMSSRLKEQTGFWGYAKVTKEYNSVGQLAKTTQEYQPKTFWDLIRLLLISLVLAGVGYWFTAQQNQTSQQQLRSDQAIALDQQRETILKTCMDDIKDLLLNKGLRVSKPEDEVRVVARAEVLASLRQLDGERKGMLLQFLSEARLITSSGDGVIIDLSGANLTGADLSFAQLSGAVLNFAHLDNALLSDAVLSGANLEDADLGGAVLNGAVLSGANLEDAFLSEANLGGANLSGANLSGANLTDAVLSEANLTAITVTKEQLYSQRARLADSKV